MAEEITRGVSFVYFTYGDLKLHNRTIFSILSLASEYQFHPSDRIYLFTDTPDYFKTFLEGTPLSVEVLDPEKINMLMGVSRLIHRVKISIIEIVAQKRPANRILYIDSDTFFLKSPEQVLRNVDKGQSIMHLLEYPMSALRAYPIEDKDGFGKMSDILQSGQIKIGNRVVKDDFDSWNAGVIGLHPENFDIFEAVFELTDQLFEKSGNHACEQFAFSYILQAKTVLSSCEYQIFHYWHKVKKQITDERLPALFGELKGLDPHSQNYKVRQEAMTLSRTYEKHTYWLKYKSLIDLSEGRYLKGYWTAMQAISKHPGQSGKYYKNLGYYFLKMLKLRA